MQAQIQSIIYNNTQVVIFAVDKFESKYIFVGVEPQNIRGNLLGVKITPKAFNNLSHGRTDIRKCFEECEDEDRVVALIENEQILNFENVSYTSSEILYTAIPDLIVNPKQSDLVALSIEENSSVICVSFDVPEAYDKPKINLSTFVEVIDSLQNIIESAFHGSMQNRPSRFKKLYKSYRYDQLELIGFGPGSFSTYLRNAEPVDLSGSSPAHDSLAILEELVEPVNDRDKSLIAIQKFKGHIISAYKRFINALYELNVNATISWAIPSSVVPYQKSLTKSSVTPTYELLKEREEFEAEIKIIDGFLVKVNKKDGTWILRTDEGVEYNGFCFDNDVSMVDGLVVNIVKYRFTCREYMERNVVTEKRKFRYELREKSIIEQTGVEL